MVSMHDVINSLKSPKKLIQLSSLKGTIIPEILLGQTFRCKNECSKKNSSKNKYNSNQIKCFLCNSNLSIICKDNWYIIKNRNGYEYGFECIDCRSIICSRCSKNKVLTTTFSICKLCCNNLEELQIYNTDNFDEDIGICKKCIDKMWNNMTSIKKIK